MWEKGGRDSTDFKCWWKKEVIKRKKFKIEGIIGRGRFLKENEGGVLELTLEEREGPLRILY